MIFKAGFEGPDSMREKAIRAFSDEMKGAKGYNEKDSRSSVAREKPRLYKKGGHTKGHALSREQTDLHIPRKVSGRHSKTHYSFGGLLGKMGGLLGGLFGDKGREIGTQVGSTFGGLNDEIADNVHRIIPFLKEGGSLGREMLEREMAGDKELYRKGGRTKKRRYSQGGNAPIPGYAVVAKYSRDVTGNNKPFKKGGHSKARNCYAEGGDVYEREMVGDHPSRKAHHYNYEAQMRGMHSSKKKASRFSKGGMALGGPADLEDMPRIKRNFDEDMPMHRSPAPSRTSTREMIMPRRPMRDRREDMDEPIRVKPSISILRGQTLRRAPEGTRVRPMPSRMARLPDAPLPRGRRQEAYDDED